MIRIGCERQEDEGWMRRFVRERSLPARVAERREPWDMTVSAGGVTARGQTVSCGIGRTSTVTVSSLLDGGMAALQREMTDLNGRTILPREIPMDGLRGTVQRRLLQTAILLFFGKI